MRPGPSRGEKFSGELRHAAPGRLSGKGLVNVEEAGDDAFHVGVHAGDVVAEGDARYGRGRIGADARQGAYGFRIGGKAAVKAFLQDGSGPDHGARPRIVAESLPGPEHGLLRGCGECGDIRKLFHPFPVIGHAAFHLRLLEHDFRDPHMVGLVVLTPGQGAACPEEPVFKGFMEGIRVLQRRHDAGHVTSLPQRRVLSRRPA